MDIKWKNISRQLIMWAAVAAILISTFFGIRSSFDFLDSIRVANEGNPYFNSSSFADYVSNRTFDESDAYQEYLSTVLRHYLYNFEQTGEWEITDSGGYSEKELESLDIHMTGTITYPNRTNKKTSKKESVQVGEKVNHVEESVPNIVYANLSLDYDYSNGITGYISQSEDAEMIDDFYYDSAELEEKEGSKLFDMESLEVWIEIPQDRYDQMEDLWSMNMHEYENMMHDFVLYGCVIFASVIVIIITASPKSSSRWEVKFDRMWLEVLLCLTGALITAAAMCFVGYYGVWEESLNPEFGRMAMAGILIFEFLTIYCCISMVRKIKSRYFIKSSICYKVLHRSWIILKDQKREWEIWSKKRSSTLTIKEKSLRRKRISLLMILAAELLIVFVVMTMFGIFPIGILALIWMVIFFQRLFRDYKKDVQDLLDLEKVLQQIYEISNGNLNATTDIGEDSLYYKATTSLCDIGSGMAKSVEEQVKSERMKVDLITNVSHDLKTPLTSIISYIDLLSRDEALSDEARDYVTILEKKAERLKNIVTDLFDLAKTTSGNVKAEFSIMDMRKLVEQTLIEMDDKITSSGFEIITAYDVENAQFQGDANRMYRVVQNVIDNALKYSLKGSRIYIHVQDAGKKWKLSVTNTAAYRMEFTEEEILERFTRGDESRTTEGSGLGLSIADSFTRFCGGDFHVKIRGDQFTVEIAFVKY